MNKQNNFLMLIESKGYLPNEILNASYNYTPHEINVILMIIARYKSDQPLIISIDNLTAGFGESNSNNKYLKDAITGILSKPLEYWNKDKNRCLIAPLISSATICLIRRSVRFTFDPDMAKIIERDVKNYTTYEIKTILNLQSRYAKRIYLHCNAWRSTGLWTMKIEDLRKKLCCVDKYPNFADFKKRILDPAFEEINEKSEYTVETDFSKIGNKIESLMVTVVLKKQIAQDPKNIMRELKSYGLADWQIRNAVGILPEDEIEKLLNGVKMNRHQIKNIGGYLVNVFSKQGVPMDHKLFSI
jgi:plasmid replication initiation protein